MATVKDDWLRQAQVWDPIQGKMVRRDSLATRLPQDYFSKGDPKERLGEVQRRLREQVGTGPTDTVVDLLLNTPDSEEISNAPSLRNKTEPRPLKAEAVFPEQRIGRALEDPAAKSAVERKPDVSLLSRMGGYAKDNPELIAQIAQLGGGLVANYAQGKAQEKADKTTGQRVARSNLISALSGGKIRPGVAEEVADSGGLLTTIGQVVQGGGKIAENEMGRRLAEETRLRGEKMEDEELVLAKGKLALDREGLAIDTLKALRSGQATLAQKTAWAKSMGRSKPGLDEEGLKREAEAVGIAGGELGQLWTHYSSAAIEAEAEKSKAEQERRTEVNRIYSSFNEDVQDQPGFKDNQEIFRAVSNIVDGVLVGGASKFTGYGDMQMIKSLALKQDPGSTVREQEYEAAKRAQALFDMLQAKAKGLVSGEMLTSRGRKFILELAVQDYLSREVAFENSVNQIATGYIGRENAMPVGITKESLYNSGMSYGNQPITSLINEKTLKMLEKKLGLKINVLKTDSELSDMYGEGLVQESKNILNTNYEVGDIDTTGGTWSLLEPFQFLAGEDRPRTQEGIEDEEKAAAEFAKENEKFSDD